MTRVVDANRAGGADGDDGRFEFLIVTGDGGRHTVVPGPAAAVVLMQLTEVCPVLLRDSENRTLIGADLVGEWLPLDWTGLPTRS